MYLLTGWTHTESIVFVVIVVQNIKGGMMNLVSHSECVGMEKKR